MFSNKNLRFYLFLFLAFSVLSSKHIFIYNEETLVALSFFCFLFFILHYFGNTLKDSLNERSQVIREELQNFLILKQKSIQEVVNQHQKVSGLKKALSVMNTFTKNELHVLTTNTEKALKATLKSIIQTKLKTLVFSKLMTQQKLQFLLSEKILSDVLAGFPKKGKGIVKLRAYQNQAIRKSVQSFVVNANK